MHLSSPASGAEASLPLHHAVHAGSAEIARSLLAAGADAMAEDGHGWSALARAHQAQNCDVLQSIREVVTSRATPAPSDAAAAPAAAPSGLFLDSDDEHKGHSDTSELSRGSSSDDSDGFVVG